MLLTAVGRGESSRLAEEKTEVQRSETACPRGHPLGARTEQGSNPGRQLPKAPVPVPGASRRGRHSLRGAERPRALFLFQHQRSSTPLDRVQSCRLNYLLDHDTACRSPETFAPLHTREKRSLERETRLHDPLFADGVLRPGVADRFTHVGEGEGAREGASPGRPGRVM